MQPCKSIFDAILVIDYLYKLFELKESKELPDLLFLMYLVILIDGKNSRDTVIEDDNVKFHGCYKFTSKELDDETGLYYFGARYYDAQTSRWMSADPILEKYLPTGDKERDKNLSGGGGVFNPINLNLYCYAGNNPLKYNDPNGKEKNPVLTKADDFLYGFIKTVVENSLPINESDKLPARDSDAYRAGVFAGNIASLIQAGIEIYGGAQLIEAGAALFGSGVVLDATGAGALVGVAANAAGVVIVVGGTTIVVHGTLVGTKALTNILAMMKKSGSYTIEFESGKKYHGKGDKKRMEQSAKRLEKQYKDKAVKKDWSESPTDKEGFIDEYERLKNDGGPKSDSNYNKIESPGKKYKEGK